MKISYINGICFKNDAISSSLRDEITWLRNSGLDDIRLYVTACDFDDLPFVNVGQLRDIVYDPHFQTSDLVILHYGVYYPLFDVLPVCPASAKKVVVFHNVTPKEYCPVESHEVVDKSFFQMSNIQFADHVICPSRVNMEVLRLARIETPATILPLALPGKFDLPESKPSADDGLIRIAFIGRFVSSKGPVELLSALESVLQRDQSVQLRLDMIGNLSFSDPVIVEQIKSRIEVIPSLYNKRVSIGFHGDATEELKTRVLKEADLFVLPTYHEGFCVPVLEALASACKVVAYENSNIPSITGGFANLSPTGDVSALSKSIADTIAEVSSPNWRSGDESGYSEYALRAGEYVREFSPAKCSKKFLKTIRMITGWEDALVAQNNG